jgi:hypothetical protein
MIVHLIAEVSLEFPYVYTIAVELDMRSAYQIFSSFLTIRVTQEVMNECRMVVVLDMRIANRIISTFLTATISTLSRFLDFRLNDLEYKIKDVV